jgi:D-threo-aldose 1-dehydrogenase
METIALGTTERQTTRLGFGCSSVMGALGRRDSLALLESSYEAGIRHFDVAPSYGFGEAESCLGEFLARHQGDITVTTKFGISPPARGLKSSLRSLARPLLKAFPGLKRVAASSLPTAPSTPPAFDVDHARQSLEHSLALLRGRIDCLLLHEATAEALTDDRLLRFLEDAVFAGKIGTYGVGSPAAAIPALLSERPAYCPVTQYEWSVLDSLIRPGESFRIHHRALTDDFQALQQALADDAPRRMRWSDHTGQDLSDPRTLAALMLKAALLSNPYSIILFSSKNAANIAANAALAGESLLDEAALRLYALVRSETVTELQGAA